MYLCLKVEEAMVGMCAEMKRARKISEYFLQSLESYSQTNSQDAKCFQGQYKQNSNSDKYIIRYTDLLSNFDFFKGIAHQF